MLTAGRGSRQDRPVQEHGFVLAGGRGSRMGRDKSALVVEGKSLLERAVALLRTLDLPVTVVLAPDQEAPPLQAAVIRDLQPDRGPLGGLQAALHHSAAPRNLVLACDLPLLPARLFETLRRHAPAMDIVLPADSSGKLHPLCACYSSACLSEVERMLESPTPSLHALLESTQLRVRVLRPSEHGLGDRSFFNLNTPADLQRLEVARAREKGGD